MSKLTGKEIQKQLELGNIIIDPFDPKQLNSNSYNVRLGSTLLVLDEVTLDLHKPPRIVPFTIDSRHGYRLLMDNIYLGHTVEIIGSKQFIPIIDGRSTAGRYGLSVHVTAGFGDVGFIGTFTLELEARHRPITVYEGDSIAQVSFETVIGEIDLYNGSYQGQRAPKGPKPLV
jgi:dCTP deaminase